MPKKNSIKLIALLLLAILVLFLLTYYYIKNNENSLVINTNKIFRKIPIPTSTPIPKPIPHGKQSFVVSIGQKVPGPRMGEGFIEPYDPAPGTQQTLTIEINNFNEPVEKVVAVLVTDKKVSPEYPLKRIDGSDNGRWQGSWIINDSYLYNYILTVKATGPNGTSQVDITLR